MIDQQLQRVEILLQHQKYSEAESILKELLATEPNHPYIYLLLGETYLAQDKPDAALQAVNTAIGLDPQNDHLYYLKARIALEKEKNAEAESHLHTAIQLNAYNPHYFALWANIKLHAKKYEEALDLADKALEIDPENIHGLNIRSTSLSKLNRHEDSFQTIEGALREDPNNEYTHTNYGWNLLEKGQHRKALEHFRQALKINPNYAYAKSGMLEALKAKNIIYRLFLKYAFWMNNLSTKYQWVFLIGFYFGTRALSSLARNSPELQPYLNPLIILLTLFALSTWVIAPISNLMLRISPYGKHLLTKAEILSSNFVGVCFLLFVLGVLSYLALGNETSLGLAVFGFAMMIPCAVMFNKGKYQIPTQIYAGLMAVIGLVALFLSLQTGDLINNFTYAFLIMLLVFQWGYNIVVLR